MSEQTPTIVLVHGAFAESASWTAVVEQLQARGHEVVAAANPLRSVAGDAAYLRDVISAIGTPVVLVGHSYGGVVITEAAAHHTAVVGLVYVAGFAPDHGESALQLSTMLPAAPSPTPSSATRSPAAASSSPSSERRSTSSSPPTCPRRRPP
jgi:pimeloyl-ACP methyl ester carboxylesterase